MSEKRFELHSDEDTIDIIDLVEDEVFNFQFDVVSLSDAKILVLRLNRLAEENEKLNSEMRTNLKEFSRLFKQNFAQKREINDLQEENKRLKNKLNVTALELVDESISMGKAVEISEMNYHEFLRYRQKKGKPMELKK